MYLIHAFSRNRERCSEEPQLESTALYDSERSTAGSSHANYQYVYITGKVFPRSVLFTAQTLYKNVIGLAVEPKLDNTYIKTEEHPSD